MNTIREYFLLGALLESLAVAEPATGIISIAPSNFELGAGWGERRVVYAIDPLKQPAEFVNAQAGQDPANRASIMRTVREALARNGAVAMAEFWYLHSLHGFPVELTLTRYPDPQSLDKHWKEVSAKFDITQSVSTAVGQSAAWLQTAQAKADRSEGRGFVYTRILVFRQGLFTGWVEGIAELGEQPLLDLAKATADRMASDGGSEGASQAVFRVVKADLVSRCLGLPVLLSGAEAEVWVKSEHTVNRRERKAVLVCVAARGDISVQIAQERSVHHGWQVASAEIYQLGATGHEAGSPLHASVWPADMLKRDWLVPWQFRGTLEVNADPGTEMRERAFCMVGWALNEERVRTADGGSAMVSGPRYVGDPVSPEGLEAARIGRAVHAKLLEQRSSASDGE